MILQVAHVILNGGAGAPADLTDGEFYIDEAAGLLYLKTESGIYGVPLSVLIAPDAPEDATQALVKLGNSVVYTTLSPGGGGRPFDDGDWRIPGRTPLSVTTNTFGPDVTSYGLFEMSETKTLSRQRVVFAGTANVIFGVCEWVDGAPGDVITTAAVSGSGLHIADVSASLTPGTYATFFTPDAAVVAQVVHCSGYMDRISPDFRGYPVALSF